MEVPGKRKDPDLEKGSQENARVFCEPCDCDGKHVSAEGFCGTCEEYLCAECFKVHTIPSPSRNHVLLDKANMPRSTQGIRKPKSTCIITCPHQQDQVIEYFCPAHNVVMCRVCVVIKHKQCDTNYIPDMIKEYKNSKEYIYLFDTINHLDKDMRTLSSDIKRAVSSVKKTRAKAITEIKRFRKEVNAYLHKKEQELVLAIKRMEQEDIKLLQNLTDELDSLKNENSTFKKQLKSVDAEISDLFVTSKQLMTKVQSVLDRFVRCSEKNVDISYTFKLDQALKDLLASNGDFGEIKKSYQPKDVRYSYQNITLKTIPNIDFTSKEVERKSDKTVKTSKDKKQPRITGMVLLSSHTLLLVDYSNKSVKTLDTTSNTILSRLSLSSWPWDIALLPRDQAAVTLPNDKQIQIISTKDKLSSVRTVNFDGSCYGISATVDNLIVSFAIPSKVDIMNFQGKVLVSVSTDNSGQALFNFSQYNTIVKEKGALIIYVSDNYKQSITKLLLGGQVLSTYTHDNWRGLMGMTATGDGQLLVCNYFNNTVDIISEGGETIQKLLDSKHGIKCPEAVCYCAYQNMLYVSSKSDGTVHAYKFT